MISLNFFSFYFVMNFYLFILLFTFKYAKICSQNLAYLWKSLWENHFWSFFVHLSFNNFLNSNQSGCRPGDSCVHQVISITHDIHKAFDTNPSLEIRRIFLNLSKAFDKVWNGFLLHKLRRTGICEIYKYFKLTNSFLSGRFQRGFLNDWPKSSQIKIGLLQGSILAPFLFLA